MYPALVSFAGGTGNGLLLVQGLQTNIAQGSAAIGPFSIACSPFGSSVLCPDNATTTVPIPGSAEGLTPTGVILVASATATMTCSAGFISGQLSRINPSGLPTIWIFDPAAVPSNLYVTVSNTADAFVVAQFI